MARLLRPPIGLHGLLPLPEDKLPILYQEEEDEGKSEADIHVVWSHIIYHCLIAHLADRPQLKVCTNMNLLYRKRPRSAKTKARPNLAADTMVVEPFAPPPEDFASYALGEHGPAPLLVVEVLSKQTAKKHDLTEKPDIYAGLAVAEYVLADPTGKFLHQPLLLKRLRPDRTWKDLCDADGGITSQLGFRIIVDVDGLPRLLNTATGKRYVRPYEAQAEADLRQAAEEKSRAAEEKSRAAEERSRVLEAELLRLRESTQAGSKPKRRPKS
jgi:Uma2 family endonuclease